MTARNDLLRAVQEYEALMTHSAGLTAEVPDHRKEAIQVRRRIAEKFGAIAAAEPSHFFGLPESENVSAVMLNPVGTIPKFNRMGFLAGFGDRRIKMTHSGIRRGEIDPDGPGPLSFSRDVHAPGYVEKWIEGTVILHNPNARIPLDPELIPGANHEFLKPDGSILSMLPEFQPYSSGTAIVLDEKAGGSV